MEEVILLKIHKSYRLVVAVCDREVYGKKLVDGKRQLDLTGKFFKGDEKNIEEVKKSLIDAWKEDATFNIVGENSTRIALEIGLIKKEGISKINGIPFALVLL